MIYATDDQIRQTRFIKGVQSKVNAILGIKDDILSIAYQVLRGDWGNGIERKQRLSAAGYDYTAVQKKVNEILGIR